MNVITITGRIGKDAETRHIPSGAAVASFSVANNVGYGKNEQTLWFDVSIWGKQAEGGLIPYLVKGQEVAVSGELTKFEADNGKTYLKIRSNTVDLVGGKPAGNSGDMTDNAGNANNGTAPQANNGTPEFDDFEDTIPF